MGYWAQGSGDITLRKPISCTDLEEVERILEASMFEYDVYESGTSKVISIWYSDKYFEQEIIDTLNDLKQYASDIYIKFSGEDGQMWEFLMKNGEIETENLEPVASSEYSFLLRCKEYLCRYINNAAQETCGSDALRAAKSLGIRNKDLEELGFDWLLDLQDTPPSVTPEGNGVEDDDNDDDTVSMSEDLFNFLIGGGFIV